MGRIGLAVSRLALAFGMEVVYQKRTPYPAEQEQKLNIRFLPLNQLIEKSDVITLHCPATPDTYHLFSEKQFGEMKPSAVLINTARGPVVDEKALLEALSNKTIAGAALDVFEWEPKITEGLLTLDNVVLTPHIGSSTMETRTMMTKECVKHIIDFYNGEKPTHVVNLEVLHKNS